MFRSMFIERNQETRIFSSNPNRPEIAFRWRTRSPEYSRESAPNVIASMIVQIGARSGAP